MGHMLRGAVTAWLGLIALQTAVSHSNQADGVITTLNNLVQRALSPDVPAIPDRRKPKAGASSGGYFNMSPAKLAQVVQGAKTGIAVQAAGPDALWNQLSQVPAGAYGNLGAVDWAAVANAYNATHG